MRTIRWFHLFTTLLVAVAVPASHAQASDSAKAETVHNHVPAVAEVLISTCPFGDWLPQTDTICEDWDIFYYREGDPSELREQPWRLYIYHPAWIVHPDGTATLLYEIDGLLENPQGSFDEKSYTYAQVSGNVPMSDGSEVAVDLTWDMAQAELHHGGNNSIYNQNHGFDPHYNDRCLTLNIFAHQQWRAGAPGEISGTVGGVDIQSFFLRPDMPFTAGRSVFTMIYVEHGGCAPIP